MNDLYILFNFKIEIEVSLVLRLSNAFLCSPHLYLYLSNNSTVWSKFIISQNGVSPVHVSFCSTATIPGLKPARNEGLSPKKLPGKYQDIYIFNIWYILNRRVVYIRQ